MTQLDTVVARPFGMRLHAVDAWLREPSILVDSCGLRSLLHRAAAAGGATVLADEFYVFPNGAVTGVRLGLPQAKHECVVKPVDGEPITS